MSESRTQLVSRFRLNRARVTKATNEILTIACAIGKRRDEGEPENSDEIIRLAQELKIRTDHKKTLDGINLALWKTLTKAFPGRYYY